MTLLHERPASFDLEVPVLVIGAGACGLTAALAARDAGIEVLVVERDTSPSGSTSLSSGFVPAAATRYQRDKKILDSADLLAADIQKKAHGKAVPHLVETVAEASGPAIDWLGESHGIEWIVLDDFLYPGHTGHRMHAVPEKTGAALEARLLAAAERAGVDLVTGAHVTGLFTDKDRVRGVRIARPDGSIETIGCRALVLACNGYGGNPGLVRTHIPQMADALYFGHAGNTGDALLWGSALGGETMHLSAYQGHGSVAHPHGVLITWALMMEGGIQVNTEGGRFSNEHEGYSEQSVAVLKQTDQIAWNVYDGRLHELGLTFPDYRDADAAGAIRRVETVEDLAVLIGCPQTHIASTITAISEYAAGNWKDPFGRDFTTKPELEPPYYAVRVTGALFHTQGGLMVDKKARVIRDDGTPLPNLFAGGGAACGVSGPAVWGYLSGNGLLTAITLGRLAGEGAAELVTQAI